MEELYKDSKLIKQKLQIETALENICNLMDAANASNNKEQFYIEKLLNNQRSEREHFPLHEGCDGCESERLTEKRICRCMYYYNANSTKCRQCKLSNKWKNIGSIRITDYEYPTKYVLEKVGGMDLIFDDEYAVEVKPPNSKETISRMFAEILTYTIGESIERKKYKPAICIFNVPDNKQMKQFKELWLAHNECLLKIMDKIKIFYFEISSLEAEIVEYEIKDINELIRVWS